MADQDGVVDKLTLCGIPPSNEIITFDIEGATK